MKNIFLLLIFMAQLTFTVQGQITGRLALDFTVNSQVLKNPLVSGLNAPQFSAVDLNEDGILDLYVFDRVGNRHLTFVNEGVAGEVSYIYAPEYEDNFPEIKGWVVLRDYDGDNIVDIFAYSDAFVSAVMVYKGSYENNEIQFNRFNFDNELNSIYFPTSSGFTQLYVSDIDYPSIDDLDCDGDLDILTFSVGGGYIEWFRNTSVEEGFGRDSLHFVLEENCWGGMFESGISNEVNLGTALGECYDGFAGGELDERHSGSSLLTLDMDNDGDKELFLGDISFANLLFLTNGGNCDVAWLNQQENDFPAANDAVDLDIFPTAFYLDVDNDGVQDMLVSPGSKTASEDHTVAWFYKNVATNEAPSFELQQKDLLIDQMLDFGSGAQPFFIDYNADGLMDLVVGNYAFYKPFGERDPRLFLFLNTGTNLLPSFTLENDNFLNMSQFSQSSYNFYPSFGDLDGDGDWDILIGEASGRLFYGENTAGAGNTMTFAPLSYNYKDIDVGSSSTPQIIDLDRDGLKDLVIGEKNGNINFFKNTGTATSPAFNSSQSTAPNIEVLGGIDTRVPGYSIGHSAPRIIDTDANGYVLYTGSELGQIEVYTNIDGNLDGTFTVDTELFSGLKEGIRTHIAFADLNNDGLLDLAVGNFRGGLSIYTTDIPNDMSVGTTNIDDAFKMKVFPNPAQKTVHIVLDEYENTPKELEIYDVVGRLVYTEKWDASSTSIVIESLAKGVYFVSVEVEGRVNVQKLVVE